MNKKLSEYLEMIGQELHDHTDTAGISQPITKDEVLARKIWERALGCEVVTRNTDGNESHRIYLPDPKAQTFIFERREGKNIIPTDEQTISLIDKISEISKARVNDAAEKIVNGHEDSPTDSE